MKSGTSPCFFLPYSILLVLRNQGSKHLTLVRDLFKHLEQLQLEHVMPGLLFHLHGGCVYQVLKHVRSAQAGLVRQSRAAIAKQLPGSCGTGNQPLVLLCYTIITTWLSAVGRLALFILLDCDWLKLACYSFWLWKAINTGPYSRHCQSYLVSTGVTTSKLFSFYNHFATDHLSISWVFI